jgi:hypothetical protein
MMEMLSGPLVAFGVVVADAGSLRQWLGHSMGGCFCRSLRDVSPSVGPSVILFFSVWVFPCVPLLAWGECFRGSFCESFHGSLHGDFMI